MNKSWLLIVLFLVSLDGFSQAESSNAKKGEFSLGLRSTGSFFSASGNNFGLGTGGQFRYRLADKLNTEWFADWITTDINGLGSRIDAHIGESMFIYFTEEVNQPNSFTPYVLGGFCGDYTRIRSNRYYHELTNSWEIDDVERWSFASQLGFGTHYNLSDRFDFSFTTQYILHFGDDIHSELETNVMGEDYLHIHHERGGIFEGHWFFSLSANYVIADLLKNK